MKMAWTWFAEEVNERTASWWVEGDDVLDEGKPCSRTHLCISYHNCGCRLCIQGF